MYLRRGPTGDHVEKASWPEVEGVLRQQGHATEDGDQEHKKGGEGNGKEETRDVGTRNRGELPFYVNSCAPSMRIVTSYSPQTTPSTRRFSGQHYTSSWSNPIFWASRTPRFLHIPHPRTGWLMFFLVSPHVTCGA